MIFTRVNLNRVGSTRTCTGAGETDRGGRRGAKYLIYGVRYNPKGKFLLGNDHTRTLTQGGQRGIIKL